MVRTYLALAVLSVALIGVTGCDRGSENTTNTTPSNSSPSVGGESAAPATTMENSARRTAHNLGNDTANTVDNATGASTQPGATTRSSIPGLPSVNGTSTTDLKVSDAAAVRLIDNAKNNLKQGDVDKAKTLLNELKQPGMYDNLSAQIKSQVDELETQINNAPAAPAK